ncbi:MAG: hypothetical protein IKX23_06285 [Treponema sp.]|nr:hypothetical protein [Treponema sp.]
MEFDIYSFGTGGGGYLKLGYDFGLIEPFCKTGFINTSGSEIIKDSKNFRAGFGISFDISRENILSFPEWITVYPEISVMADLYNVAFYRNLEKEEIFTARDITIYLTGSINVCFPCLMNSNNKIIPEIGYNLNFRFDKSSVILENSVCAGIRFYFSDNKVLKSAEETHEQLKTKTEENDVNKSGNNFAGINGAFVFPMDSSSALNYGTGYNLCFEFGYNFGLFDFFLFYDYSSSKAEKLIKKADDFRIGIGSSFIFDRAYFSFMPSWFRSRLEICISADFYKIEHRENEITDEFFVSSGITPVLCTSLFFDFPVFVFTNSSIVPVIGYTIDFHFDLSGVILSNQCSVGIRYYF